MTRYGYFVFVFQQLRSLRENVTPPNQIFKGPKVFLSHELMFSRFQITNCCSLSVFVGVWIWTQYGPKVYVVKHIRHRFFLFWASTEQISDSDHDVSGPGSFQTAHERSKPDQQRPNLYLWNYQFHPNHKWHFTTAFGTRVPDSTRRSKPPDNLDQKINTDRYKTVYDR